MGAENISGNYGFSPETGQKILKLKSENCEIEAKVLKEREKYQMTTQAMSSGISAIPMLPLKNSMILNTTDASYILTLEVPTSIDNVLLQSDVQIDLLDVEKNSAVVSYSDCESQSNNVILVAYRCQVNTNRLEIKIRTIEGQYGTLQAYITPSVQPKCCQLKQFDIKPLSLHIRRNIFDDDRPFNVLILKGAFSLAEMHSWISKCFPEVPEKPQIAEKSILIFQSVFSETIVQCSYCKGEAEFKSDNVSTISILKEFLTKEATKKKIKTDINCSINDDSIKYTIKLINSKLIKHLEMKKKLQLIEALHELEINDKENLNYLTPKYRNLLNEEVELKQIHSLNPTYLERLYGIIQDLFIDYNKLKGVNARGKIPQLMDIIENYDFEKLLNLFFPNRE